MHGSCSRNWIVLALITLSVSACSLQSDYVAPNLTNPDAWSNATTPTRDAAAAPATWWRALHDSAIDTLIDATFANNPTLDKAVARIDEARAQTGVSKADYSPILSASGSITETDTRLRNGGSASAAAATGQSIGRSRTSSIGPSLSWELDLFGRVRASADASRRRLDARTADAHSIRLFLAAQVATTVLDWRACAHTAQVDAIEIDSRGKTLALTRKKMEAGFAADVDVASVTRDLAAAQGRIVAQQETCARHLNALVELSGLERSALAMLLTQPLPNNADDATDTFMPAPPAAAPQLPATVLLTHPSVIAADRDAAAAWADIGTARANRLPKLDISAALTDQWLRYGGSTFSLTTWSVGPSIAATLFDAGKGAANVDAAQARYRQAVAALQETVRTTVKEVENALAAQQSAAARIESFRQSTVAAEFAFNATQAKWKSGTASLFELEDARRQYAAAQDNFITAARDRASAWVELVRATANGISLMPNETPLTPISNRDFDALSQH